MMLRELSAAFGVSLKFTIPSKKFNQLLKKIAVVQRMVGLNFSRNLIIKVISHNRTFTAFIIWLDHMLGMQTHPNSLHELLLLCGNATLIG